MLVIRICFSDGCNIFLVKALTFSKFVTFESYLPKMLMFLHCQPFGLSIDKFNTWLIKLKLKFIVQVKNDCAGSNGQRSTKLSW